MTHVWPLLDRLTLGLLVLLALALMLYGLWELAVTPADAYPFGAEAAGWVYASPGVYGTVLGLEALAVAAVLLARRRLRQLPPRVLTQGAVLAAITALHL